MCLVCTRPYRPGITYAILSSVFVSVSFNWLSFSLIYGIFVVKHINGASEHSRLSSNTDKLPETVIWP